MLKFKGITVREIELKDIETVQEMMKLDSSRNLYVGGSMDMSREEFINFILSTEYNTKSLPMIIEKGEPIGIAIINNISQFKNSACFRILMVKEEHRKKGRGIIAGAMIGAFLFYQLRLNKVYAGTWSHNPNMEEIYKWTGAKLEGVERQHAMVNGEWVDRKMWGLLREEIPEKLESIFMRVINENYRKDIRATA